MQESDALFFYSFQTTGEASVPSSLMRKKFTVYYPYFIGTVYLCFHKNPRRVLDKR